MMKELMIALSVVSVLSGTVGAGQREGEALLAGLSGVHGLNRASVCVMSEVPVRRCEAALVSQQWAAARPACVLGAGAGAGSLRVVRASDGLSCADVEAGVHSYGIRRVLNVLHPSPPHDLALLSLDWPYVTVDHHSNTSYVNRFLKEWEPWMSVEYRLRSQPMSLGHTNMLLSTPMRMLVTTVVLPTLSFIALFMFVVFCTGPRDPIPYQAIEESETEKTDSLSV